MTYTPTTGAILNGYVHYRETQGKSADYSMDEFHRWLAEHDRQTKAQALEEAAELAEGQDGFVCELGVANYIGAELRYKAQQLKEEA